MCYMVRQQQSEAQHGGATLPPGMERLRPRWLAAGAAAVLGGLALAAFTPAKAPTLASEPSAATVAPVADKVGMSPPGQPVVDQRTAGIDDGVPAPAEVSKAQAGHCHHGL